MAPIPTVLTFLCRVNAVNKCSIENTRTSYNEFAATGGSILDGKQQWAVQFRIPSWYSWFAIHVDACWHVNYSSPIEPSAVHSGIMGRIPLPFGPRSYTFGAQFALTWKAIAITSGMPSSARLQHRWECERWFHEMDHTQTASPEIGHDNSVHFACRAFWFNSHKAVMSLKFRGNRD